MTPGQSYLRVMLACMVGILILGIGILMLVPLAYAWYVVLGTGVVSLVVSMTVTRKLGS